MVHAYRRSDVSYWISQQSYGFEHLSIAQQSYKKNTEFLHPGSSVLPEDGLVSIPVLRQSV